MANKHTISQKEICFSFDDGEVSPALNKPFMEWNTRLLDCLEKYNIRSAFFTSGCYVDNQVGKEMLADWSQSGHVIGNHTYEHLDYHEVDAEVYFSDILRNRDFLSQFTSELKYFRPPYLRGGNSALKQKELESFLASQGLIYCGVTVDTADWYINERMMAALASGIPVENCKGVYREIYLDHLLDRANYYNALAHETLGRSIQHMMLLHHNLAAVWFLEDLIQCLKKHGWEIKGFQSCLEDPIYQSTSKWPIENSLVWMQARDDNKPFTLRNPGEHGIYEEHTINEQERTHFKSRLNDI